MPGFRSKLWLRNKETGEFGGIYEWDTEEDAHNADSTVLIRI
ncbi:MAG: hypothetical protein DWQ04_06330 [Chloroflexi bacterium]|nr:MAG: hypothetical protein DWQ04_06330 [Chloroflexota bacterium]